MQITHEEARRLIQFKSDAALGGANQEQLATHLRDCIECTSYATEVRQTEQVVRSAMKKHWSRLPLPLQLDDIKTKNGVRQQAFNLLIMRTGLVSLTVLFMGFALWQFTFTNSNSSTPLAVSAAPVPTPSIHLTTTRQQENCVYIQYQVGPLDTLETLAMQFSTSAESIAKINNLRSASLKAGTELIIPICSPTPTGTVRPPAITTTPYSERSTYTPG